MICAYCDTDLPSGALFCGECGRATAGTPVISVGLSAAPPPSIEHRQGVGFPPFAEWSALPALVIPRSDGAVPVACEQCGASNPEEDIFCGGCGFVSRAASEEFSRSRETAVIEAAVRQSKSAPTPAPMPAPASIPASTPSPVEIRAEQPLVAAPVPYAPRAEAPFDDAADLEATRISHPGRGSGRFVLQFSTGESFTVYGNGLIGRNPRSEPGEHFDQLVRVLDPSRSVSKVHLEFGQDTGHFWILDRFSGNGTIVREPDSDPVRCPPDKRFRITRGTRVDIGDQFFIVS